MFRFYRVIGMTVAVCCGGVGLAQTQHFTIVDDGEMDRAVSEARAELLAMRGENQPNFTRLDATILVKQDDGSWRRGSFGGEDLHYPASTVKMAFMAAAAQWERDNDKPVGFLEPHVGPMVTDSDNPATGRVVDIITGTSNVTDESVTTMTYEQWRAARMYTADFLSSRGLLGNQVVHVKTYPTNSGPTPVGFEERMWKELGRNAMQTNANAELMLEIVKGKIDARATDYMRRLMTHDRWKGGSVVGFGLPPGAVYENKPGRAYDSLADFAYIVMPETGQEIVLTVLSNAYCDSETEQPSPYGSSILGVFTEGLIEKLGLDEGAPPKIRRDNADADYFAVEGDWVRLTSAAEKWGEDYLVSKAGDGGAVARWRLGVPEEGLYEVCAWHVQSEDNTTTAVYTIAHGDGKSTAAVDQQHLGGRWVKLGDFRFTPEVGMVTVTNASTGTLTADAVKVTRWPGVTAGE